MIIEFTKPADVKLTYSKYLANYRGCPEYQKQRKRVTYNPKLRTTNAQHNKTTMTAAVLKTNGKTYAEILTLPSHAPNETATPQSAPQAVNNRIKYLLETMIRK